MADDADHLARARTLHMDYEWREACDEFRAAGGLPALGVEDVERFAECAQIAGLNEDAIAALERSFEVRAADGQVRTTRRRTSGTRPSDGDCRARRRSAGLLDASYRKRPHMPSARESSASPRSRVVPRQGNGPHHVKWSKSPRAQAACRWAESRRTALASEAMTLLKLP